MLFKKLTLSACVIAGALLVAWAATAALVDEGQAPAAGTAPIAGAPSAAILLNDPGKSALHGRVLQPDGKPVAGARVWASGIVQGPPSAIKELAEDYTDVEGRFRLGPFESQYRNRLEFNVEPPHRFAPLTIPRSAMLTFPGLDWDLGTILLDPGRVFTGQVLDFDGKPVQWAKIAVYRHEAGHTVRDIGPHITLTTDVEGRFRTPPLHVGRLALSVRVPERQVAFAARTIRPGGEEDLGTIRLEKDLPVTGIVKDDDGRPVAGATVFSGVSSAVSTDNEGKFTLRGFGPNPSFQMNVRKDGYALLIGRVTVNEAGIRYETANNANPAAPPRPAAMTPELTVTLKRVGWLEEPKTVGGLVARLKKKGDDTAPAAVHETITGTVTRDGRPVQFGWVGVWRVPQSRNPINAPVLRGRMVMGPPISYGVAIHGGAYAVDLPFPGENWYVVVEEPGHPLTQVGPISVARNQKKTLDIACKEGGRIRGRVTGVPPGWEGNVWVVAFSKSAVREEARVARDGTFSLPALPAGEYGLKAGHDAYEDAEVYPVDVRTLARDHPEVFQETADPWKRAKVVTVEAGKDTTGVELELPAR